MRKYLLAFLAWAVVTAGALAQTVTPNTSVTSTSAGPTLASGMATFLATPTYANLSATCANCAGVIPINSQSAAYTTVAADQGKSIYHPPSDTTARTWTIDSNANVPYPLGTAITFDNDAAAGTVTLAITADALVLVGSAGSTAPMTLAPGAQATAIKVTATRWRISGSAGLTSP